MMKFTLTLLIMLGAGFAHADEIVEKQILVCVDAADNVYGGAMTRHRSASYDRWYGQLFTETALAKYEAGADFSELGIIGVITDYNGRYPEFTAQKEDGSTVNLYSCKKLGVMDNFSRERDWYLMLKAFMY